MPPNDEDQVVLQASVDDLSKDRSSIHNTRSALQPPSSLPETTLKEGGSMDYDDDEDEYDDEDYDDEEEEAEEEVDEVQQ